MNWPSRLMVGVILATYLLGGKPAFGQQRQWDMVRKAILILDEVTATNKKGLPPLALRHAYAVAIIPDRIKGGFIIGASHGEGVVLVQTADGSWSFPILVSLSGGSFGFQAGVQSSDLILVFKNRQTVDSFLQGRGKLMMGVDGSLALGGLGGSGALGTGAAMKSQYVAFSRSRGLFAGASVTGSGLTINEDSNAIFYGQRVSPAQILQGQLSAIPEPALTLQTLLMQKSRLVQLVLPVEEGSTVRIEGATEEILPAPARAPASARTPSPAPAPAPRSRSALPPVESADEPDLEPLPPPASSVREVPSSDTRRPPPTEEAPLRFTKVEVEEAPESPPARYALTESAPAQSTSSGWYQPVSRTYRQTSLPVITEVPSETAPRYVRP